MPAVKLTKNELKKQKDSLKRYKRYLPTLILKKQQLQMVIRQLEYRLAEEAQKRTQLIANAQDWLDLFTEFHPFQEWLSIASIKTDTSNVAGVEIPVFKSIEFKKTIHDLFMTPPWVDDALIFFAALAQLDIEVSILQTQVSLLDAELRTTSQRVNLFEKVKIPQAVESIKKIQIYLGDQQTAAVVRGKTAKKNLLKRVTAS